jgi:anti-sigma factor RsiW
MTCRDAESRLPLYIDHELARGEVEDLERHLAGCAKCHDAFEVLRDVSDNIRAAKPLYDAPLESEARVRELIRARDRALIARRWRLAAAISAADVAYLAYSMNRRPISLLVTSASQVKPGGGQTFRTGGIEFHFSSERGLRLITWSDRGLSYALVSDPGVTGAESCVICHGSTADRKKIGTLPE